MNENKGITYQNLWDAVKGILRGKFTAVNAYIFFKEITNISNLKSKLLILHIGEGREN